MKRILVLVAAALFAVVGCDDQTGPDTGAGTPTGAGGAPVKPGPPPEFWSAPAGTPEQQSAVAQATRELDVCALLPRDTLEDLGLGDIRTMAIGLDSCRAVLGGPAGESTLTWHTTLLPPLNPTRGISKQFGEVTALLVPVRDGDPRACGATARFPAGAAFYLGIAVPDRDSCAVADGLLPGIIERWRQSPGQGTSPDTVHTVLLGADPCAVRAKLAGTTDTDQRRLTECLFRYRDETVTVSYAYRVPEQMRDRSIEEKFDGRTVYRSTSLYDPSIPIYHAQVGPELPLDSTEGVPRVPVVEVTSATDGVARDVMAQALTLFPQ